MKSKLIYFFLLLSMAVVFTQCNSNSRKMPDLAETYLAKDKKPFGAYVAYHQLEEMFYRNTIRNEKNSFEDSWKNLEDTGSNYICIANTLYASDADISSIINFVKNGNDAFLSANKFDEQLLAKLECKVSVNLPLTYMLGKQFQYSGVKMDMTALPDTSLYRYFYFPFYKGFSAFNATNTRVLGLNENGDPNFIVVFKGKGRFFLHSEPRAFSNYFLLQQDNYKYLQKVFGYMRPYPDHIYWNDYYQDGRRKSEKSSGTLGEILKYPPLAAAFWLTLILFLLYIFFGMKRRQRVIELLKPNENTTVTFTETIGRLYLQKKDNKNIADKMITYFNEYIRNNYFLNTNIVTEDFITTLSRKSGVQRDKVEALYRTINHAHANAVVDDYQLMSLNEQIQNFYKTSN